MATSWCADRPHRCGAVLATAFLLAALHGIGDHAIVGDDEAREVGIVQDILRGRVLLPRFNDELLPDKPILTHWLAASAVAVAGFSETAVRFPSAIAGAGIVWWTTAFGQRLLGAPAGVAAGGLIATMPALFSRSRLARPDVVMLLLLVLALAAAWSAWRDGDRRRASAAWTWLGLATFAKGPVAPALAGATLALFLLWERDWRAARRLVTLSGVLAFAGLGGSWYLAALVGWGDTFVEQHLLGRYLRNLAGGLAEGRPYSPKSLLYHLTFYPLHLPAIVLPWTPLIAAALWSLWRSGGHRDPRARFLLCWLVSPVLVFAPAEWKLRYYLLPALPAAALLAAPLAVRLLEQGAAPLRVTRQSLLLALAVMGATILAAALLPSHPQWLSASDRRTLEALAALVETPAAVALGVGALTGIVAVIVACRAWGVLVVLCGALTALWLLVAAPALDRSTAARDGLRDFAREVAARVPPGEPLVFYDEPVRTIVVYLGRPIPSIRRRTEQLPRDGWVLAAAPAYRALFETGHVTPPLLRASGRLGSLGRGEIVLAKTDFP